MRKFLHINLRDHSIRTEELHGEAIIRAGRHLIAKTLLARGVAKIDPLSPENPLIFSAGPFAGTNFSNANRISVGCKSPLTGGIKEANSGGTFGYALGQIETAGLVLYDASKDWVVIRITKEGEITFENADPYMGKGNNEVATLLFEKYGKKVSFAVCGPVGEYLGLASGIGFADTDGRPSRVAARGGVGAVMGSKKVKAIVVDIHKMPTFHDRKKVMGRIREYGRKLSNDPVIDTFKRVGTAMMGDFTNRIGGLPVRNFSAGRLVETSQGPLKLGGDFIRTLNMSRGGEPSHACMPGCQIECSNIYVDAKGTELVSPLEYETLGLMGSNCGLEDPDDVARLNGIANDLGVDTIEVGATLGVLMDAGMAKFGDVAFMTAALEDMRVGNERGRLLAQGTARVGEHYKVARIPVIKGQGISAYDPRVIEVTGISMMVTAQGADHTSGNLPAFDCKDKTTAELVAASLEIQSLTAAADSLGLCIFGRSVTNISADLIVGALNDAHGTNLEPSFFKQLGLDALRLEWEFNRAAGFSEADDELPSFFYDEPLAPSGKAARHHSAEVNRTLRELLA
ncbi:MAG: aldehyde ferredoxin oxidoreductase [Betaproteobacteria bacterium RIFCSPLOWO2_12_FULL_63_13]|nr:MAG: aldehyde ferredoxin oxidoreductase [Betaproteobacteria bacterium RIFCSPLOWO2_02_FULL_63_19]OGA45532.1 MAG: aldehyde ferredoxin oxidoreductase [Betaproteobacteria bacterium RIFCSPLOWO2_12_FULL_63_13]